MQPTRADRIAGALYGTAIGDALGLYVEGLPADKIAKRFGRVDHYLFMDGLGLLSDDTEQTALVGEALLHYWYDIPAFETYLRWLLVKWFWTFPPGIGKATAQSCIAMTLGVNRPPSNSAGNGAAMRASIIGVHFCDDSLLRKTFGVRAARVTHRNEDAVDSALYVAEVAAGCMSGVANERMEIVQHAVNSVPFESIHYAVERAQELAHIQAPTDVARQILGNSGYSLHTIAITTFCFLRFGDDPMKALTEVISCGGDTDTNAAVLGAWLGALHGKAGLPQPLLKGIVQGPIDLDKLAKALAGEDTIYGGFNYFVGLVRNLFLLPYVLYLALRRLTW